MSSMAQLFALAILVWSGVTVRPDQSSGSVQAVRQDAKTLTKAIESSKDVESSNHTDLAHAEATTGANCCCVKILIAEAEADHADATCYKKCSNGLIIRAFNPRKSFNPYSFKCCSLSSTCMTGKWWSKIEIADYGKQYCQGDGRPLPRTRTRGRQPTRPIAMLTYDDCGGEEGAGKVHKQDETEETYKCGGIMDRTQACWANGEDRLVNEFKPCTSQCTTDVSSCTCPNSGESCTSSMSPNDPGLIGFNIPGYGCSGTVAVKVAKSTGKWQLFKHGEWVYPSKLANSYTPWDNVMEIPDIADCDPASVKKYLDSVDKCDSS